MAQSVLGSLFGPTPEELRRELAQQQAILSQNASRVSPSYGIGYNVGTMLGQGVGALFGIKDPSLQKATDVQSILREASKSGATSAEIFNNAAQMFSEKGYDDLAARAGLQAKEYDVEQQKLAYSQLTPKQKIRLQLQNATDPEERKMLQQELESTNTAATTQAKNQKRKELTTKYGEEEGNRLFLEWNQAYEGDILASGEGGSSSKVIAQVDKYFNQNIVPTIKSLQEADSALTFAASAKNNPAASAALDTKMASIIRGDSKLSNQAVDMIKNADADIFQRVGDKLSIFFQGKPTDITLQDKVEVIRLVRDAAAKEYNSATSRFRDIYKSSDVGSKTVDSFLKGRENYNIENNNKPSEAAQPPSWAVNKLKQNPELSAKFDEKYGPGAADKFLGNN